MLVKLKKYSNENTMKIVVKIKCKYTLQTQYKDINNI